MSLLASSGTVTFLEGWKFVGKVHDGRSGRRPLLGRRLHNKSQRELRDLGLVVEDDGSVGERTPAELAT